MFFSQVFQAIYDRLFEEVLKSSQMREMVSNFYKKFDKSQSSYLALVAAAGGSFFSTALAN